MPNFWWLQKIRWDQKHLNCIGMVLHSIEMTDMCLLCSREILNPFRRQLVGEIKNANWKILLHWIFCEGDENYGNFRLKWTFLDFEENIRSTQWYSIWNNHLIQNDGLVGEEKKIDTIVLTWYSKDGHFSQIAIFAHPNGQYGGFLGIQ